MVKLQYAHFTDIAHLPSGRNCGKSWGDLRVQRTTGVGGCQWRRGDGRAVVLHPGGISRVRSAGGGGDDCVFIRYNGGMPQETTHWLVPIAGPGIEPLGLVPGGKRIVLGRHEACELLMPASAEKVS